MPKASAPKAPCVVVWLSPQTMVMPGCVRPSSGPMTWTMPCVGESRSWRRMPELAQLSRSASHLRLGERVGHRQVARAGGHVVVERRHREIGAAHLPAGQAQALEGLRRGDLVDQVQVDVEQVAAAAERVDDVRVPELVEQRARPRIPQTA